MPSKSLAEWRGNRSDAPDEIEQAHVAVSGTSRGRRSATQQSNRAYTVRCVSKFLIEEVRGFADEMFTKKHPQAVIHHEEEECSVR
jgi:hypothetical protein